MLLKQLVTKMKQSNVIVGLNIKQNQ